MLQTKLKVEIDCFIKEEIIAYFPAISVIHDGIVQKKTLDMRQVQNFAEQFNKRWKNCITAIQNDIMIFFTNFEMGGSILNV